MKIILNTQLRKLKKQLEENNVKYHDFMLNKKILGFDSNTQYYIISLIQNVNINKEQFNFLITTYNDNKSLFDKLIKLINMDVEFGQNEMKLYIDNKDIFELLVDLKINNPNINSLNQSFIDMWGIDFIKANYDIINKFNYDEIKEYINIIKNNPQILRDVLPLLDYSYNKKYLGQVLSLSDKDNIKDVVNNLITLKDDFLKKYYLDNYKDNEFKDFLNLIIDKYNGKIPIYNYNNFIQELTKETGIKNLLAKKIYYCYLSQLSKEQVNDVIVKGSLSIIFNTDASSLFNAYFILVQAHNKGYPIPENLEYFYKFYDDIYKEKKTTEDVLNNAYDSIYNNAITFDFNEVITWIKKFKSWELSKDIINPKDKNIDYYIPYTYVEENGNQVIKQIPVIKIDDPNFMAIVHTVAKKNEATSPANYKLTEKLIENPELWETTKGGNPNISMSYLYKQIGTFGGRNGVLLGFSEITPERLLSTTSGDGATPMDRPGKDNKIHFCTHEDLKRIYGCYGNDGWGYNEILTKRYYDNEVTKPNYIMIVSGVADTLSVELAKKWASYFEIPIVEIDGKKIKQYHMTKYQTILNEIKDKHYIEDYSIIDNLYEEIALIESYLDKGEAFTAPTLYETFYTITKSLDMSNFENAQYINELLNRLGQTQKWFEIGYDTTRDLNTNKYLDSRISDEALKRMQEYITLINAKCKQVINDNELRKTDGKSR